MKRCVPFLAVAVLGGCAAVATDRSLVGDDIDALRAVLGPPLGGSFGFGCWRFDYRNRSGDIVAGAVQVVDDVVVTVAPDLVPTPPMDGPERWCGARIEQLVAALGEGRIVGMSASACRVAFGSQEFAVADGRVLGPATE